MTMDTIRDWSIGLMWFVSLINGWGAYRGWRNYKRWEVLRENTILNDDVLKIAALARQVHLLGKSDVYKYELVRALQQLERKAKNLEAM